MSKKESTNNYKATYLEVFNKEREKGVSVEDAKKIAKEIADDLDGRDEEVQTQDALEKREGVNKEKQEQFPEIRGKDRAFLFSPSSGAFFGGVWWAIISRLPVRYIIGYLIPVVNLFVWFYLFIDGKKISWKEGSWNSFEEFKEKQKRWDTNFQIIFFILFFLYVFIYLF